MSDVLNHVLDHVLDHVLVLSDDQIAELKNRINKSCEIRLAKPNGCIIERSRSSGHSTDIRLLGQ